jgi:2'-5' RNA ligase
VTPERHGPIIVTALFGVVDFAWLQGLRRTHYPRERNRVPAHLTLFSHLPPSSEAELETRLARLAAAPPPRATVAGIMDLGEGTALRVESSELEDMRDELAEAFHGLLAAQDQGPWAPHVTIQNKVERREARALQAQLAAKFEPRPLAIKGLAMWIYADGPWRPLKNLSFRG